jgi:hypothetical protein
MDEFGDADTNFFGLLAFILLFPLLGCCVCWQEKKTSDNTNPANIVTEEMKVVGISHTKFNEEIIYFNTGYWIMGPRNDKNHYCLSVGDRVVLTHNKYSNNQVLKLEMFSSNKKDKS